MYFYALRKTPIAPTVQHGHILTAPPVDARGHIPPHATTSTPTGNPTSAHANHTPPATTNASPAGPKSHGKHL